MTKSVGAGEGPLAGIRVIDFGWVLAGPYATMLLSYLGAEVIKVESRRRIDEQRNTHGRGVSKDIEASSNFLEVNLGKRSVSINISEAEGAELARKLVADADVALENMRPGVMSRLGLGYDDLSATNPGLIMLSISGWGQTGPLRDYSAYAPCFSSFSGLAGLTGYSDGGPNQGTSSNDARAGTAAAFAILAALNIRESTGQGQYIDLAASYALNALIGDSVLEYFMTGQSPERMGNHDPVAAPHNVYRCAGDDRWISISVTNESEWLSLRTAMSDPAWARDEMFNTAIGRQEGEAEIDRNIGNWTKTKNVFELHRRLQEHGVPSSPSLNAEDIFTDEDLLSQGRIQSIEHEVLGVRPVVAPPMRLSETPAEIRSTSPRLGEANEYVFRDILGLASDEVERLIDSKVIY